jgi:hypothetical protein
MDGSGIYLDPSFFEAPAASGRRTLMPPHFKDYSARIEHSAGSAILKLDASVGFVVAR